MKQVLLICEGDVAKALLHRLIISNNTHNHYDIVYSNDAFLIDVDEKPTNFTFYKFDPTSYSKLSLLTSKTMHDDCLIVYSNKFDTIEIIKNIKKLRPTLYITVYNFWNLEFQDTYIQNFNAIRELSNALMQKLPNIPVLAQSIGLRKGEIMEVKIPFGSSYVYRYIGSISQNRFKIVALYRNGILLLSKPTIVLKPNDILLLVGEPKVLLQMYNSITQIYGHFPLPFGKNLYLFLDLLQTKDDIAISLVKKAKQLQLRLNSEKLIIKIINPSQVSLLNQIKSLTSDIKQCVCEISYEIGLDYQCIKQDIKRFGVGLIIVNKSFLKKFEYKKFIYNLKIPIYKSNSLLEFLEYKSFVLVLNKIYHYEQISPIV
jgi:hypothetical protein